MTKPTNEERREVARKLRKNAEEHPKMQLILNVAFACDSLRPEGAMDWNVTAHDAAMYLADLIEPDPERTCRKLPPLNSGDRYTLTAKYASGLEYSETLAYARCSECGAHFCDDFAYCPKCGAKVTR